VTFALTTLEFTVNKGSCGREILYEYETLRKVYQVLTGMEYVPKRSGSTHLRGGSVGSKSNKSKASGASSRSVKKAASRELGEGKPIEGEEEVEEIKGETLHSIPFLMLFQVNQSDRTSGTSLKGRSS
jgi:hypothetical protein